MWVACMGALNLLHSAWVVCTRVHTRAHAHTPGSPLAATSGPADGPQWACDDAHTKHPRLPSFPFTRPSCLPRQDTRLAAVVPGRDSNPSSQQNTCWTTDKYDISVSSSFPGAQPGTSLPRKYQLTDGVVTTAQRNEEVTP